jgi:ABC-type lipopolysaccharide export system ATPase subunit
MSTSTTDPILDASEIHAWYGSSHVLHGVDLAIARGETVGLLGRNGTRWRAAAWPTCPRAVASSRT